MTKEELKQEAEEYANNLLFVFETDVVQKIVRERVKLALIDVLETREKQIAELEQENKVLAQNLEDTEIVNKALEKENAELKGLVNQYKASKCGSISLVNRNMIMFDQLTKAKEIIKEFVEWATWQGSNCPSFKSIQDKAEQFLNSEVEK